MQEAFSKSSFGNRLHDCKAESLRHLKILALVFVCIFAPGSQQAVSQELRLITSPWPPSNYLDETGEPTGLGVEIVEALKSELGVSTPVEMIPWARGYLTAKTTPNVMLFTGGKTQERIDMGFEFIGPAVMWRHVLIARADANLTTDELADVRAQNLAVAGVRGSWQIKHVDQAGIRTVEVADQLTGARMLLAGRVDLWITSQLQASVILKELGVSASAIRPIYTVRRSPSYLMISKGTEPVLLAKWKSAFETLKASGRLNDIAMKWSAKLGIPLGFGPDEGFFADMQQESENRS